MNLFGPVSYTHLDICFVPDGDYASFIEEEAAVKIPEGNFVDLDGRVLGRHKGITHYTVGQRKGLGLSLGHPAFVLELSLIHIWNILVRLK